MNLDQFRSLSDHEIDARLADAGFSREAAQAVVHEMAARIQPDLLEDPILVDVEFVTDETVISHRITSDRKNVEVDGVPLAGARRATLRWQYLSDAVRVENGELSVAAVIGSGRLDALDSDRLATVHMIERAMRPPAGRGGLTSLLAQWRVLSDDELLASISALGVQEFAGILCSVLAEVFKLSGALALVREGALELCVACGERDAVAHLRFDKEQVAVAAGAASTAKVARIKIKDPTAYVRLVSRQIELQHAYEKGAFEATGDWEILAALTSRFR